MEYYKGAKKIYVPIENIHVMRDSITKVVEALRDGDASPFPPSREILAKSNWLKHLATILDGAGEIVQTVHVRHSHVILHCSDGWDRTSQLAALSQICLDPYYRTFEGISQDDWINNRFHGISRERFPEFRTSICFKKRTFVKWKVFH
jgi:hypothetical protein